MEDEPHSFSMHTSGELVTVVGSINSRTTTVNKRPIADTSSKKHRDPFPQALDGPSDAAASYAQVEADSKPRLAEMHGVLQAPPPMLSSRY